ncbi:MAG: FHIPEP family type III secretion protein, partial [Myxococcota bacterium]
AGTQVWLGPGYVTLHLAKAARKHLSLFVGIQSVSEIVNDFGRQSGALVQEVVPAQVSLPRLARVLRALIEEGVSIRDIGAILDALAEAPSEDLNAQVEAARAGLGARWMGRGPLPVLTLAPELEARIHASLRDVDGQVVCTLSEGERGGLTESVLAALSPRNDALVVTHAGIRRSLQRLLQPHRPDLQVVSYAELLPGVMVESIGRIDGGALMSPPSP